MRLRPRRGSLVILSSSGVPAGIPARRRPTRSQRIRWWLRIGALLTVIGVRRAARNMRTRWEPISLGVGVLLMMIGFALPADCVAYFFGILVLVVTLLKGIASKGRAAGQAADCWRWRG